MGRVPSIRFRDSWFKRARASIARISALPLLVMVLTGWIPNKDLELGPKDPWPWGAIVGIFFIVVAFLGLLRPQQTFSQPPLLRSGELETNL
jgi:hypothetical protein